MIADSDRFETEFGNMNVYNKGLPTFEDKDGRTISSLRNLVHRTSGYPVRYEATPPSTPDQPSVEPSKAWGAAAISLVDASPSSLSPRLCFRAYVFDTYPNRNLDFRCPAVFWLIILKTAFPGFFQLHRLHSTPSLCFEPTITLGNRRFPDLPYFDFGPGLDCGVRYLSCYPSRPCSSVAALIKPAFSWGCFSFHHPH